MLKRHYKHSGLAMVSVLALVPLFFWLNLDPLSSRFASLPSALRSLGQICGLTGAALMSINIILATRLPFLERLFPGLNAVYQWHHRIGAAAFILLLVHPVLLAYALVPLSLEYAYFLLIPSWTREDLPLAYGRIALLAMATLLVMTFYFRPRYHIWKISHRFLGLALLLAMLHVFFIVSDVSRSAGLKYYMLGLMSAGIAAGSYRILKGAQGGAKFRVAGVRRAADNVTEIELAPAGRRFDYESGQFLFVKFHDQAIGRESHPFSIHSSPEEANLRISAKVSGDYTARLPLLKEGTAAKVEGPFGRFNYQEARSKRQAWIAGGIGITPFLGMARQIKAAGHALSVDLFYSARTQGELVYLDELKAMADGNFRIHVRDSSAEGRMTAEAILAKVPDWPEAEFFLCGPVRMMRDLKKQLAAHGVSRDRIHSEEFEL